MRYKNLMLPQYFMDGQNTGWYKDSGGSVAHFKRRTGRDSRFEEKAALVVDSWRLHNGEDINGPRDVNGDTGRAYYKQVDRMAFVTNSVRDFLKGYLQVLRMPLSIISMMAMQPPLSVEPTETTLVSMNYKDGNRSTGQVTIREDSGQNGPSNVPYDTAPFGADDEYQKTFEKRGEHFMGCKDPEKLGCFDSTSQDNPFGSFVEPPENP